MKRIFLILIGLIIGLSAAVIIEGRMGHLRWALGDNLPDWTNDISATAGVLSGDAAIHPLGTSSVSVKWSFQSFDFEGVNYRMTFQGHGVNLSADISRPYLEHEFHLNNLRGDVDLAKLPIGFFDRSLGGGMNIQGASIVYDPSDQVWKAPAGAAGLIGLQIEEQVVGNGTLNISSNGWREWLADISISGEPLIGQFSARGTTETSMANVTGEITEGEAFLEGWQRALSQVLPRSKTGWRVDQEINLGAFVSLP